MKDYEKIGLGIASVALGFAAYQTYVSKKAEDRAVDSMTVTDALRSPITGAVELAHSVVGNTTDWFTKKFNYATGRSAGKPADIINTVKAIPNSVSYSIGKIGDLGYNSIHSGGKYLWGVGAKTANTNKNTAVALTNKAHTLMGSATKYIYDGARTLPSYAGNLRNAVSYNTTKAKNTVEKGFSWFKKLVGR